MDASNDPDIDTSHRVFDAFRLAGYGPEDLTDPGHVTAEGIESGGWSVARWTTHGLAEYDTPADSLREAEWAPAGVAVEYGNDRQQPIDFADEMGPLNAEIPPVSQLYGRANASVTFFVAPDVTRDVPDLDAGEAVRSLALWGSEGYLSRESVEALTDTFGASISDSVYRDDPDSTGTEIARTPAVVTRLANAAIDSPDVEVSNAIGHKKRRRERFHGHLDALADEYGIDLD